MKLQHDRRYFMQTTLNLIQTIGLPSVVIWLLGVQRKKESNVSARL